MPIGQRMGSLKDLKASLAKGGAGFIKFIPKNGSMTVRFIEEPEHWVNYLEHYDEVARQSFPCSGEDDCPGCLSESRKSSRYLANAVNLDDGNRVVPLQLPKDLANRLVIRYERNGTLTDRNFELSRSGEGLDTIYDVDAAPQDKMRISRFQPLDLMGVLQASYDAMFGDNDEEEEAPPARKRPGPARKQTAAAKRAVSVHDDAPEEDEEPVPARKSPAAKKAASAPATKAATKRAAPKPPPEPEFEVDEEDEEEPEDETPEVEETEEDEGYTREELEALPLGALRAVAREFGVDPKGLDAEAIIDSIMETGESEENEDDPPF